MSGFRIYEAFCTEHGMTHDVEFADGDCEFEDGLGNRIDADECRREWAVEDARDDERMAVLFPGTREALAALTIRTSGRTSHPLAAVVSGLEVETRIRCQDDNHRPGYFNPSMGVTFCHCGRVRYAGSVPLEPWPDREARLVDHVKAVMP